MVKNGGVEFEDARLRIDHDAGIVDQDVEAPEVILDFSDGSLYGYRPGHIEQDEIGLQSLRLQLLAGRNSFILVPSPDENLYTSLRQLTGNREADSPVCTGDQRRSVFS
jgi:hypothetical protein